MTDYEKWVQQVINNVASEEKHENIYKRCEVDENIARLNGDYNSNTRMELEHKKMQADLERSLFI